MSKKIAFMLILILVIVLLVSSSSVQLACAQIEIATFAFISVEPNPARAEQDPVLLSLQISPAPPTPNDTFRRVAVKFTRPDGFIIENYYDTNPDGKQEFRTYLSMTGSWVLKLSFAGQTFGDTHYLPCESQITFTRLPPPPPSWSTVGNWTQKASMHVARGGLGVAVVNGKIYAIGGSSEAGLWPVTGGFVGTNEEYDLATNTWTFKKPMPTSRQCFAIATYQNKIYCIGGTVGYSSGSGYSFTGANEAYDPVTDTWETKKPMPTPRDALQANVASGKIYLIGGYPTKTLIEVYDPENDSWITKAPMPSGASSYASAVIDNRIYIIGGDVDPPVFWSDMNRIYDPAADKWSLGAPAPSSVCDGAAGVTTGVMAPRRIYVMGVCAYNGLGAPPSLNRFYDPANDKWTIGADVPTSRLNLAIAVVNDILYAIGGHTHNEIGYIAPSALNEVYMPFGYGTVPPAVTIISPENKTYDTSDVPLTIAVNKPTTRIEYCLDGLERVTITGNTTLNSLSNGSHNVTVIATDAVGNTGISEATYFTIVKEAEMQPQPRPESPLGLVYGAVAVAAITMVIVIALAFKRRRNHCNRRFPQQKNSTQFSTVLKGNES